MNALDKFRKGFFEANNWDQRRDGVPLHHIDNLSAEELKVAEVELIKALGPRDDWPIIALGHIKSQDALPTLIKLLADSEGVMKVIIAHSIFQISKDERMKDIVLDIVPKITAKDGLIWVLHYLPTFNDKRITYLLHGFRYHKEYLVAYNATRCLGLPIEEVVEKFRIKEKRKSFWDRIFGR